MIIIAVVMFGLGLLAGALLCQFKENPFDGYEDHFYDN